MRHWTGIGQHTGSGLAAACAAVLLLAACGQQGGSPGASEPAASGPATSSSADVGGETITLRYASNLPEGNAIEAGTNWWISELEARTDGRVTVEAFFAGSLLGEADILRGVQDGVVDIGHISSPRHAAEFSLWSVTAVPFLGTNMEASQRALAQLYDEEEAMRAQFEEHGVFPLFFKPVAPGVAGFNEPVTSLADLEGRLIRSQGGYSGMALEAIGAEPVSVNAPDVYEAMERGTIGGWSEIPVDVSVSLSLHEVSPYYANLGLGLYVSVANVMSLETWNSLPADVQAVIEELNDEYYAESVATFAESEAAACDTLLDAGVEFVQIPESEVESWRSDALDTIMAELAANWEQSGVAPEDGEAFFDSYRAAYEQAEAETSYDPIVSRCGS